MSAQTYEFQAEAKQLLDLMVHSLYSNKDIFLRELISNASDALDKLRFEGVTQAELLPKDELHIFVEVDSENRTLTLHDNGIGMTRDEVVENIGVIAHSGTSEFAEALKNAGKQEVTDELIGQFGVGFYSCFMVADRVTLITRRAGEETACRWTSHGDGSYTIEDAPREHAGTSITLHLKTPDEEDGLKDYTEEWILRDIVKRYSDFVSYPIRMLVERSEPDPDDESGERRISTEKMETLNSMKAIWARSADEVSEEEYKEFYRHISHDWSDPLDQISLRMEGVIEARALLYIPSKAPVDLYHRDMNRRGIQLYVKRVFIMDECKELLPDYLRFIKGVIDAEDLSLNVSREILQQDRQIQRIRKHVVKKIMEKLEEIRKDNGENFRNFWAQFGPVLKEGLLDWDGSNDRILDLLLTHSTHGDEWTSLDDYVERMPEGQSEIYYITGETRETVANSPHLEAFRERGYEVLYFTDRIDEVWLQRKVQFKDHALRSVGKGDVELGSEEERKKSQDELEARSTELKDLLACLGKCLESEVKEVRVSNRLKTSAACLVGDENDLSPQLAELLRSSGQDIPENKRVLEVNPDHPILKGLDSLFADNPEDPLLTDYAQVLHGQAVLSEGGRIQDGAAFSQRLSDLMVRAMDRT